MIKMRDEKSRFFFRFFSSESEINNEVILWQSPLL